MTYKVIPIPAAISDMARETMVSPQYKSLAANVSLANGYGPCRSCLQTFHQGKDDRIYFTYNPFAGPSDLPDPGPIFIHRKKCQPFGSTGFPLDLLDIPMLFEGFGDASMMLIRQKVDIDALDTQIAEIFQNSSINYIKLRNAEAGCFIARIERF